MAILAIGANAGCSGRTLQADNPVLGAAPPRKNLAIAAQTADSRTDSGTGTVDLASFDDVDSPRAALSQDIGGVAATVNGRPILVADVVERFTPQLRSAEAQLPEAEFSKLKRQLIKRELPAHIEQAILVDSALSKLGDDQQAMVEEQLDKFFSQYLTKVQADVGTGSLAELEAILQQQGTSITNLQRSFNNRQLADQAMGMLAPPDATITRREMLEEYQSRLDEFTEPEMVRWQQVWISYKKHGGKDQALGVLDQVVNALKSGASFEAVAHEYSDGVKAADGGQWDWTQRGELSNEEVERMLFELPVGEVGKVIADENALQIVRVTERKPETTKTFAEMQNQLGQEIKLRKKQDMLEEVLAELKEKAVVTTMFDGEEDDLE